MKRREFITLLGGAAASLPLALRAQQPAKLPTVGFLGAGTPSTYGQWVAAFMQQLRERGWIEGRNIAIELRCGARPCPVLEEDRKSGRGGRNDAIDPIRTSSVLKL